MCERVTIRAFAATDVTTGHANTRRTFQPALRAYRAVDLKGLAVCLLKMWAFAGSYTWHIRFL